MRLSFLSVALALTFVNAAPSVKTRDLTWEDLARKMEAEGSQEEDMGTLFSSPAGSTGKGLTIEPKDTTDGRDHACVLTLVPTESSAKRLDFVLSAAGPGLFKNESDEIYFQTSLDGKLVKAIFGRIKLDESGERILGSGTTEVQDLDAPRIKALFQKEVDFWLKGLYRKKPASDKEAAPPK